MLQQKLDTIIRKRLNDFTISFFMPKQEGLSQKSFVSIQGSLDQETWFEVELIPFASFPLNQRHIAVNLTSSSVEYFRVVLFYKVKRNRRRSKSQLTE